MKKIATILLFFLTFHYVFSQDTLHHPSRYLHYTEDSVGQWRCNEHGYTAQETFPWFKGVEYSVDTQTVIYGVAVTFTDTLPLDIAIWGMLVEKDKERPDVYYVVDSSAKNYYREPDKYYAFLLSDSCDGSSPITYDFRPVYEFFYPIPHTYFASDTFYVGYKAFNKACGENMSWDYPIIKGYEYSIWSDCWENPYSLILQPRPSYYQQWVRYRYSAACYPILVLDTTQHDTTQHETVCEADLTCGARVEGFSLYSYYLHQPIFQWQTEPGQLYQLGYAPYGTDSSAYSIVDAGEPLFQLFDDGLDSNVMYVARIRTSCHHQCPVHDTVTWGPWSDPVFFHTGQHLPDTSSLSIPLPSAAQRFTISPNPAIDRVTLTVPDFNGGSYLVTLLDQNGRSLSAFRTSEQSISLEVKHLPAGLYLITVKTDEWSASQRLVVE